MSLDTTPRAGVRLGVVEGFYGSPWSHEARRRIVRFGAPLGVDTFIWAPKNEPAHRDAWDERPTVRHVAAIAELAAEARRVGVRWVYGISPVLQRGRTSRDASAIAARLTPIQAAGVRAFLIAFDDTWPTFVPRFATEALGRAHGDVARIVDDALRSRDAACEVLIVPAIYAGRAEELPAGALAYLRGLADAARGLQVAWTGPRIFSSWIARADVVALEAATGLRLWIWNNAIANDWLPLVSGAGFGLRGLERLAAGPPANLAGDLADEGRLVVLNGAREAALTLPHVACLADWGASPLAYDAALSFRNGLRQAFGAEAATALAPLLDASGRHALAAPARTDLAALDAAVATFVGAIDADRRRAAAAVVRAALAPLAALPETIARSVGDDALRFEVFGVARKLALLAEAAGASLDLLEAGAPTRGARRVTRARIDRLVREAASVRWDVGDAPFRRLVSLARRA